VILLPVPAAVPPQLPVYHLQAALPPRLPPFTERVMLLPLHTESFPVILLAATEKLLTLIVLLTQEVVLQVPSARTK
jgi:hypothetical protein